VSCVFEDDRILYLKPELQLRDKMHLKKYWQKFVIDMASKYAAHYLTSFQQKLSRTEQMVIFKKSISAV
jgi:hypothetical protein